MSSLLVHELLAALLSHTGDIVQATHSSPPPSLPTSYHLSRSLSFIDPSERQRIDSILHLGCLHHHLLAFTNPPPSLSPSSSLISPPPPLYLAALRLSVSTLLTSYQSTILYAEATARTSSSYPLSSLQLHLQPYTLLFPPLTTLLSTLDTHPSSPSPSSSTSPSSHGSQLLSLFHTHAHSTGYPLLSSLYLSTLHDLLKVWLGQVEVWCVYGQVDDPHGEFLIQRLDSKAEVSRAKVAEGRGKGKEGGQGEEEGEGEDRYAEVWDGWVVRAEMVPSFISTRTVQLLHFIGRAVNLLQLHSPASPPLFLSPPFVAFLTSLAALRQSPPPFSPSFLDTLLTPLHAHLTQRLSSILLSSSDLTAHLRGLHSFVLLSDPSFTHFLLTHAAPLLSSPPTAHVTRDLSALLHTTLTSSALLAQPLAPFLFLTLDSPSFHFPSSSSSFPSLHCLGDFAVTAGSIRGRRGAAWHEAKMLVEHGWEAVVTVAWEGERGDERVGWGFALQNDALSMAPERGGGEGADESLMKGLVNSVVVEVTRYTTASGLRREQLAVFHFQHPPVTSAPALPAKRMTAVTGSWGLFDGKPHTLTIAYTTAVSPTLTVIFDGQEPAALAVSMRLAGTMQLDAGRAWVGVVAGGVRGAGVRVERMSMQQQLPTDQPLLEWRNLRLSLRVRGPLSLILRPSTSQRYATLFRFLFDLARCNHQLQQSWHQLSALRRLPPPLPAPLSTLLGLRQALHFFTSTILHHVYHSIIHPSLAALLTAVPTLTDFLQVRRAHEAHLMAILQGCWVRDRVVMGALREVMGVAERVVRGVEEAGDGVEGDWVGKAKEEWERLAALLLTVWTRKAGVVSNPALSSLLLSLDYNLHFTRIAIRTGLHSLT